MPVPVDLSKLSDVVKNDVVKKTAYDKLVAKVNSTDTSGFVLQTEYDTNKLELENKIPDTSGLIKKTDHDNKITEIEGKIADVSNLVTKTALTTVRNKIAEISKLATKAELNAIGGKIPNIRGLISTRNHDKDINEIKNDYVTKIKTWKSCPIHWL